MGIFYSLNGNDEVVHITTESYSPPSNKGNHTAMVQAVPNITIGNAISTADIEKKLQQLFEKKLTRGQRKNFLLSVAQNNDIGTLSQLTLAQYAFDSKNWSLLRELGVRPPEKEEKSITSLAQLLEKRVLTGITLNEFSYRAALSPMGTEVPKDAQIVTINQNASKDPTKKLITTISSTKIFITDTFGERFVTVNHGTKLPSVEANDKNAQAKADIDKARNYLSNTLAWPNVEQLLHIETIGLENGEENSSYHIALDDIPGTSIKRGMVYEQHAHTVILLDKNIDQTTKQAGLTLQPNPTKLILPEDQRAAQAAIKKMTFGRLLGAWGAQIIDSLFERSPRHTKPKVAAPTRPNVKSFLTRNFQVARAAFNPTPALPAAVNPAGTGSGGAAVTAALSAHNRPPTIIRTPPSTTSTPDSSPRTSPRAAALAADAAGDGAEEKAPATAPAAAVTGGLEGGGDAQVTLGPHAASPAADAGDGAEEKAPATAPAAAVTGGLEGGGDAQVTLGPHAASPAADAGDGAEEKAPATAPAAAVTGGLEGGGDAQVTLGPHAASPAADAGDGAEEKAPATAPAAAVTGGLEGGGDAQVTLGPHAASPAADAGDGAEEKAPATAPAAAVTGGLEGGGDAQVTLGPHAASPAADAGDGAEEKAPATAPAAAVTGGLEGGGDAQVTLGPHAASPAADAGDGAEEKAPATAPAAAVTGGLEGGGDAQVTLGPHAASPAADAGDGAEEKAPATAPAAAVTGGLEGGGDAQVTLGPHAASPAADAGDGAEEKAPATAPAAAVTGGLEGGGDAQVTLGPHAASPAADAGDGAEEKAPATAPAAAVTGGLEGGGDAQVTLGPHAASPAADAGDGAEEKAPATAPAAAVTGGLEGGGDAQVTLGPHAASPAADAGDGAGGAEKEADTTRRRATHRKDPDIPTHRELLEQQLREAQEQLDTEPQYDQRAEDMLYRIYNSLLYLLDPEAELEKYYETDTFIISRYTPEELAEKKEVTAKIQRINGALELLNIIDDTRLLE